MLFFIYVSTSPLPGLLGFGFGIGIMSSSSGGSGVGVGSGSVSGVGVGSGGVTGASFLGIALVSSFPHTEQVLFSIPSASAVASVTIT